MVFHPVVGMNIEIGHMIGSLVDFLILTLVLYLIWKFVVKRICPDAELNTSLSGVPKPITSEQIDVVVRLKKDKKGQWKVSKYDCNPLH